MLDNKTEYNYNGVMFNKGKEKTMNKVEITGGIYNLKRIETAGGKPISLFGLRIYVGKDKEGKAKYGFVDCKYYGDLPANDKELKDIKGRLSVNTWTKDGKTGSRPEIIVESIEPSKMFADKKPQTDSFNDVIPF